MTWLGPTMWRFGKFSAVGAIGIVVQTFTLALLLKIAGVHYLIATLLSVEAAVLHNFVWHLRWTWADRDQSSAGLALLRFNLTNGAVSLLGNLVLMGILVGVMNLNAQAANLLSIGLCSLINFGLSDRFVFARPASGV